jgi:hypothetical protein
MHIFRLPVSKIDVALRPPVGLEDLLLLETSGGDAYLTLALLASVAQPADAPSTAPISTWADLPVTDLDVLLLRLRQLVFGDDIQAETSCPVAGCQARIDAALHIEEYLAHHTPRPAYNVTATDDPGWFRLHDMEVCFRLPTGTDQLAVAGHAQPVKALLQRCLRPGRVGGRVAKRVETAMSAMAPSLAHVLQGSCPECGTTLQIFFDPRRFVLQELRSQAGFILQDIHLLATYYHWTEQHILSLPRSRRLQYVEMVRQERSPA